jgi:uncharacterized protein
VYNLSKKDYDELEDFLISEDSPEECMDISTMDGFLTAILIGPETIQPIQWLPFIFRAKSEKDMKRIPTERLNRILDLIITHYNIIAQTFLTDPNSFSPIFYRNTHEGRTIERINEWCMGFMTATGIYGEAWEPLLKDKAFYHLLGAAALFGTPGGMEDLKNDPEIKKVPHQEWVTEVMFAVPDIYRYWLPHREANRTAKSKEIPTAEPDRNAPCPCGSGKKFKDCCLGKVH